MCGPLHTADGIVLLLTEQAAAITGVTLPIDAGFLVATPSKAYVGGQPWVKK